MMKAMILAAGLGTRLRPLTDNMPKALVVVDGKTLLEHAINHVRAYGIREVIINVHHFPAMIRDFLQEHHNFGIDISISDESDELLETGGGLKKAGWFFGDGKPFLVRNSDVLSDLDLAALLDHHRHSGALATLAVRKRETSRYFLFDEMNLLCGWENCKTGERKVTRAAATLRSLAFSGIQVVNPEIFPLITETGSFSLTSMYLRLSASKSISGYLETGSLWKDAGKF
jgi:NDP-sugar pyrophosphorylase family protein